MIEYNSLDDVGGYYDLVQFEDAVAYTLEGILMII